MKPALGEHTFFPPIREGMKVPLGAYRASYMKAQEILAVLDNAIAAPKPKRSIPLRSSSSMIRVQALIDRNQEIAATGSTQMMDSNLDGVPVKLAPVEFGNGVMICAVFRAARTYFGHHVTDVGEVDGMAYRKKHNFGLIEKHFGIGYEPMHGRRVVINVVGMQ